MILAPTKRLLAASGLAGALLMGPMAGTALADVDWAKYCASAICGVRKVVKEVVFVVEKPNRNFIRFIIDKAESDGKTASFKIDGQAPVSYNAKTEVDCEFAGEQYCRFAREDKNRQYINQFFKAKQVTFTYRNQKGQFVSIPFPMEKFERAWNYDHPTVPK